jgi:hypothetical protein
MVTTGSAKSASTNTYTMTSSIRVRGRGSEVTVLFTCSVAADEFLPKKSSTVKETVKLLIPASKFGCIKTCRKTKS